MAEQVDVTTLAIKVDATAARVAAVELALLEKQTKKTGDAADDFVKTVEREAAVLGKTRTQVIAFDAAKQRLSKTQMEQVEASLRAIKAHEAHEKMMDRVKTTAMALGAMLTGVLIGALAALVAVYQQAKHAAADAAEENIKLQGVLKATGNAAGLTAKQIMDMADEMAKTTFFDDEAIKKAASEMLIFKGVQGETFKEGIKLAADMAALFGGDVRDHVRALGKALDDPAQGLMMLERQFGKMDERMKDQIKSLVENNRLSEAQAIVLDYVRGKVGGMAETMNTGLNAATKNLNKEWHEFLEELGNTDTIRNGALKTTDDLRLVVKSLREELQGNATPLREFATDILKWVPVGQQMLAVMQALIVAREKLFPKAGPAPHTAANLMATPGAFGANEEEAAAAAAAEKARAQALEVSYAAYKKLQDAMKASLSDKEKEVQAVKELEDWWGKLAGVDLENAIKKYGSLAGAKKKLLAEMPTAKKAEEDYRQALENANKIMDEANGKNSSYEKGLADLQVAWKAGKLSTEDYAKAVEFLIMHYTAAGKAATKLAEDQKKLNQDAYEKSIEEMIKTEQEYEKLAKSQEEEVIKLTQSEAALYRTKAAMLAYELQITDNAELTDEYVRHVERMIDALKRAATAADQKQVFKEAEKQAKDLMEIYKSGAETMQSFFADFLEHGKSAFSNLWTIVKRFFVQLAAQLATRYVLNVAANVMGGGAGAAGAINAATGGGALNTAGSLLSSGVFGGAAGEFGAGAAGTFVGPVMEGSAAAMGQAFGSMIPVIGWVMAAYAVWQAFKDKGENWQATLGFGANAHAYTTQGVFGAEGFQSIQGNDAVNRQIQAFMASSGVIDHIIAATLTSAQVSRITTNLGGSYTNRNDGQPAQFAFGPDDQTAGAQLTLEYLQKKYGTVFDEIDKTFADHIRSFTGTSEQLMQEIGEYAVVLQSLADVDFTGLNMDSLRAMQLQGESLSQTFQRVAGTIASFDNAFMSDAMKLQRAQDKVNTTFAQFGIEVPKTTTEFYNLVHSLDLSKEADRNLFNALMETAPAFLLVADSAGQASEAAARMAANWLDFSDLVDKLNGGKDIDGLTRRINSAYSQFQGGAGGAFAGTDVWHFIQEIQRMDVEDRQAWFAGFDEATQKLIMAILGLAVNIQDLNDTAATSNAPPEEFQNSPSFAINQILDRFNRYEEVINAQPTRAGQISMRSTLLGEEVQRNEDRMQVLHDTYGWNVTNLPEYTALVTANERWREEMANLGVDLGRVTVLTAQYGQEMGDQLFDLEKWYTNQQRIIGDNQTALLALAEVYEERRTDIIERGNRQALEAMARLLDGLRQWRTDLLTGASSPLSPMERYAELTQQYQTAFASGDITAFQRISDQLLQLGEQIFSRSGPEFIDLFNRILNDSGLLLGNGATLNEAPRRSDITTMQDTLAERLDNVEAANEDVRTQIVEMRQEATQQAESQERTLREVGQQIARDVSTAIQLQPS